MMIILYSLQEIQLKAQESKYSRGARNSKIGKKWPESSRILDYILN